MCTACSHLFLLSLGDHLSYIARHHDVHVFSVALDFPNVLLVNDGAPVDLYELASKSFLHLLERHMDAYVLFHSVDYYLLFLLVSLYPYYIRRLYHVNLRPDLERKCLIFKFFPVQLEEYRQGFPEVVFGPGKTPEQIRAISSEIVGRGHTLLVTRSTSEAYAAVQETVPGAVFHPVARAITFRQPDVQPGRGTILVAAAGTSDLPVAEEACVTAEVMGNTVDRLHDVGVAGIHRLLSQHERLRSARVLIVVAGMEGALPSVVAGLVEAPVIAVPTSIGYGASFGGIAALLGMLNSCANGVAVVNIDNGFGAGCMASAITHG